MDNFLDKIPYEIIKVIYKMYFKLYLEIREYKEKLYSYYMRRLLQEMKQKKNKRSK